MVEQLTLVLSCLSAGMTGAVISGFAFGKIAELRIRARFDAVIARQRGKCRNLHDNEDLTFDDTMQIVAVQMAERIKAEVVPQ
jgi:hypothetical protein